MTKNKTTLALSLGGLLLAGNVQAQESKLYLFNWTEYMDPEIITAFEEKYDVDVVQNYFNSNPEMFAKLNAGGASQYDIIVPSNYFVPRLIETGLVQKLTKSKLENLGNVMEQFRTPLTIPVASTARPISGAPRVSSTTPKPSRTRPRAGRYSSIPRSIPTIPSA